MRAYYKNEHSKKKNIELDAMSCKSSRAKKNANRELTGKVRTVLNKRARKQSKQELYNLINEEEEY